MSGMSSMLRIALDRDAPPHHEPNEKGNSRSGRYHPEKLLPFIPRIARESSAAWMDSVGRGLNDLGAICEIRNRCSNPR